METYTKKGRLTGLYLPLETETQTCLKQCVNYIYFVAGLYGHRSVEMCVNSNSQALTCNIQQYLCALHVLVCVNSCVKRKKNQDQEADLAQKHEKCLEDAHFTKECVTRVKSA